MKAPDLQRRRASWFSPVRYDRRRLVITCRRETRYATSSGTTRLRGPREPVEACRFHTSIFIFHLQVTDIITPCSMNTAKWRHRSNIYKRQLIVLITGNPGIQRRLPKTTHGFISNDPLSPCYSISRSGLEPDCLRASRARSYLPTKCHGDQAFEDSPFELTIVMSYAKLPTPIL